jgi:two-component system CitB family sensor kinase
VSELPWFRRLFSQTLAFQVGIIAVVLLVAGIAFARQAQTTLEEQYAQRSLAVAESVAAMPVVKANVAKPDSPALLQPIAESVRMATGVSFVVIADVNGVRRSHPNPERIGQVVSTDPSRTLSGISDTYVQTGTLGRSVRGKAPIYSDEGEIVGLVSVGTLSVTVRQAFGEEVPAVLLASGLAMLFGSLGAWVLARRIRSQTHGLEPADIAGMYERREAMLLGIREGVVGLDSSGHINLVNPEAERLLGIDAGHRDLSLVELVPSSGLERLLGDTSTEHHDVELTIGDQIVIVNVMPVRVRDTHVGTVVTLRDRTELNEIVGELESVQSLVDALRSQAHEFSNTLHTVSGLLELGRTQDVIDLIQDQTATHQRLTTPFENRISDPFVSGLLLAKSALAAEKGIGFQVESEGLTDTRVRGVREMITILGNLIDNALDNAAGPRNAGGTVSVGLTRYGDELQVAIENNGPVITPALAEKMFKDGFTTKSESSHGGLGLTLVREAVQRLNGEITINEERTGFLIVIASAFEPVSVSAG